MFQKRGTLRQMSLFESFNKVKKPSYKLPKPEVVSDIIFEIDDTDSETETSMYQNNNIHSAVTETPVKNKMESLNAETTLTDSPCSMGSESSNHTTIYDYLSCVMDITSDAPSTSPNVSTHSGQLVINDPHNFMDYSTQEATSCSLNLQPSIPTSQTPETNITAKRKLSFSNNNESKKTGTSDNIKEDKSKKPKTQWKIKSKKKPFTAGKENSNEKSVKDDKKDKSPGELVSAANVNTPLCIIQDVVLTPGQNKNPTGPVQETSVNKPGVDTVKKFDSKDTIATSSKTPLQKIATSPKTPQQTQTEPSKTVNSLSPIKQPVHTPKKLQQASTSKSATVSPVKSIGGTPKKNFGSPSKGSPRKNQELKSLKAKEGKQLQIRQLTELVGLFKSVDSSIHLKTLLNSDEKAILKRFRVMEDDQKYFVIKLFIWKRTWYNIFKFCTKAQIIVDNDKTICDIFEYLQEEEFVDTDYKSSKNLLELLDQLDKKQLKEIMDGLRIVPSKGNKNSLINSILRAIRRQTTLTEKTLEDRVRDEIEKKIGFAVKIRDEICQALFHSYTLATFTNRSFDDMQAFFRQMIQFRVVFPEFNVEEYPVFHSRQKFVLYAQALRIRKELDDIIANRATTDKLADICTIAIDSYTNLVGIDPDDCREHKNAPHLKKFSAQQVYCSVLSRCCEHMHTKKNGKPNEVKKWLEYLIKRFPTCRKIGFWYHRLIWLHMRHLDNINYETAAKLLIEVFETKSDQLTERDKLCLAGLSRSLKSSKRHKIDQLYHDRIAQLAPEPIKTDHFPQENIDCHCIRSDVCGRKRIYIIKGNQEMTAMSVEEVALLHYSDLGYPGGKHCEGSFIKALLMLYFWDIIYSPDRVIPGTFISKLQTAPLDMFTRYFYENRQESIHRRLREIEFQWPTEYLLKFASDNWTEHSHEQSAFGAVGDTITDVETVELLVTVLGRKVMAKIFERLIMDLRENSSGMPDLLLWNIDEKTHKFVEVKGEGDRLAPNQILWLDYLHKSGASIEICLVHSLGSKRKKIKQSTAIACGGQELYDEEDEEV